MKKRVLLGMSGGIDSSVAAILLQEQGFEVIGITFLFADLEEQNRKIRIEAENLANQLHIKHYTVNLIAEFNQTVIQYFISEYKLGKTPFPCAYCNPQLKFYFLQKYAELQNCSFIATGHYAQIKRYNEIKYIYQGIDPDKDQSFFLWGLKKTVINKLMFPLGSYFKTEIREMAFKRGYEKLSAKKDSLGICFIEGKNYREFLEKKGIISEPGDFIDENGKIIGRHKGVTNYTIGQRRGLGLNLNFPVFVAEIRLNYNKIVLQKYGDLYRKKLWVEHYQFVDIEEIKPHLVYAVKVRYRLQLTACRIHILDGSRAEVELLKPEAMIANGQTAVFYDNDRLIGGGFIEQSFQ